MKKINLIFFANIKHKGVYRILILCYLATIVFTFILANKHLIEKRKYHIDYFELHHGHMTQDYIVNKINEQWITYKCNTAIDMPYPDNILNFFPWIENFTNANLDHRWSQRYIYENMVRSIKKHSPKIDIFRNSIKNSNLKDTFKRYCDGILIKINSSTWTLNGNINRLYRPFSSYFLHPDPNFKLINLLWILVYPLAFLMIIVQILGWIGRGFIKKNK